MLEAVKKMCRGRGPLLLALSGGADSTALYHLMREAGHPFEVLHIDHQWRPESGAEAQALAARVAVPFHLRTLEKPVKNAEDTARHGRLRLYRELCIERHLEGVLLAHHADDQAETVLKRLFEGARLTKLAGLVEERLIEGVCLLRPLLAFRKRALIDYLDALGATYFVEAPARDLRSRMRTELLPLLTLHFGKEVVPSLCRLARESEELCTKKEHFWLKERLANDFEKEGVVLSRHTLNAVALHIANGNRRKELRVRQGRVTIDEGVVIYNKRIDEE